MQTFLAVLNILLYPFAALCVLGAGGMAYDLWRLLGPPVIRRLHARRVDQHHAVRASVSGRNTLVR